MRKTLIRTASKIGSALHFEVRGDAFLRDIFPWNSTLRITSSCCNGYPSGLSRKYTTVDSHLGDNTFNKYTSLANEYIAEDIQNVERNLSFPISAGNGSMISLARRSASSPLQSSMEPLMSPRQSVSEIHPRKMLPFPETGRGDMSFQGKDVLFCGYRPIRKVRSQQRYRYCSVSTSEALAPSINQNVLNRKVEEKPLNKEAYRIDIITADVRGAGTPEPALVTIYGEHGHSESHLIGAEEKGQGFERGSRKTYYIYSSDLGKLRRLLLQLGPNGNSGSIGWYLDRVEVIGPDGRRYVFPCGAWLGRSTTENEAFGQVAGCEERNLIPMDSMRSSLTDPLQRPLSRPLQISSAGFSLPHPEKVQGGSKGVNRKGYGHGGEDAYFYASNKNGIFAIGVADGVYEWRNMGIDPGNWSRKLMQAARFSVEAGTTDVLRVLQAAVRSLHSDGVQGSSTACIILIDTIQGRLAAANLGDSGFILLGRRAESRSTDGGRRSLRIRYRSPQQEHSFGHPYQVGHHASSDSPEDAMLSTILVHPGDIIVAGSDGLFDNLSDDEIVEIVTKGEATSGIARDLAFAAFEASLDRQKTSPYSLSASEAFDMVFNGGKSDDITVVVSEIV